MKKKIVFIIPYFGKFNNYFKLFLNSCKANPDINWLIFTDDKTQYDYPTNVIVNYMTFEEAKALFQSKFNFKIGLQRPYKLCDFKPTYGYIFEEYIKDYDFWGHCDTDLIWGNIRKFITEEKLNTFDKIGFFGHCMLYRNNEAINKMFMDELNGRARYKEVFQSEEGYAFDEERNDSINNIFEKNKIPCDFTELQANIYTKSSNFKLTKYNFETNKYTIEKKKNAFFVYDNGNIYRYDKSGNGLIKTEFLYIHMQARKMQVNVDSNDYNRFKIIPNSFDKIEEDNINEITFNKIKKKHFNLHYFRHRGKNLKLKVEKRIKKVWKQVLS